MSTGPDAEHAFEAWASLSASAEVVWRLLADLGNGEVADGFADVAVTGDGEGATRTLWLPAEAGGGVVRERIEDFDPASRAYAYRVLEFGPMPFTVYRGRLQVEAGGPGACTLRYTARFTPRMPANVDDARAAAADGFARLHGNIAKALSRNG